MTKFKFSHILALASALVLLSLIIRGRPVDFKDGQTIYNTSPTGPYELSNSIARYIFTKTIVTRQDIFLTYREAKLSAPDVVKFNGRYFSIFPPGVSFLSIPLYMIGSAFQLPQLFAYLTTTLFALLNFYLIYWLSRRLGLSVWAGLLASWVFLFATNALVYANTFTQHHLSTAITLVGLHLIFTKLHFWHLILLGLVTGLGLITDVPNLILISPILIYGFSRSFQEPKLNILKWTGFLVGVIPFLLFFLWYNRTLTGSFFRVPQFVGRVSDSEFAAVKVNPEPTSTPSPKKGLSLPYKPRNFPQGLYVLLFSRERSWFYYSPLMIIGIIGLAMALKQPKIRPIAQISASIITLSLASYAMFGDPWGGWSFGPRYLIPASAITSIFVGIALERYHRNYYFTVLFFIGLIYSVYVSSLGALTSAAIPPKQEARLLPDPIPYTYKYNQNLLSQSQVGSAIYNLYLGRFIPATTFHLIFTVLALICPVYFVLARWKANSHETKHS